MEDLKKNLSLVNEQTRAMGFPEIAIVNPNDCIEQEKNARYFAPEVFQQLVDNVKSDGRLESIPLCYQTEKDKENGKYHIISGHHRVSAAKQAGLGFIMIFVIHPKNRDEIIAKQLSHNSLVGKDDKVILFELFNEINNIQQKISSGINNEIEKIQYTSLNFHLGNFKQFILLFSCGEEERFDGLMTELENTVQVKHDSAVRIVDNNCFDKFADNLRKIKKAKNIKNNAVGFTRMMEIVENYIKKYDDEGK
ncbi:MAG: ParB/RepB/Spo0J family partition protein [Prevotellaceae bacterium]|jgi:hypothetical protein|nr:ParB/RepB/Spo0J family partition protein [Prevotellaceae bacterium]